MRANGECAAQGMWNGEGVLSADAVEGLIGYCDFIFQLQQLTLLELCALAEALGGRELSASDHEALMQCV